MNQREAIARIDVPRSGAPPARGTGALVADGVVLSALHVVADRNVDPPAFFAGPIQLTFPGGKTTATPMAGLWDPKADWVLLKCTDSIRGVVPIPLGELTPSEQNPPWTTFGFPDLNPAGQVLSGVLRDPEGEYLGVRAIQLFSDEAAAGDGAPVAGLSGAPCIVEGAIVGVIRSSLLSRGANVAGTLFACPIASVIAQAGAHLPLPDPLRGLPGLPLRDLPSSPFRDLQPYGPNDAEIFFGRGVQIRELFAILNSRVAAPILLIYGQSGVGKSSLLEAGLFPRLQQVSLVVGARRDGRLGLGQTLDMALDVSEGASATTTADAWHSLESRHSCPVFAWLDQVEEAWTRGEIDPVVADPQVEVASLLDRCDALFKELNKRPRGKLILAFRKEYLPEVETALERRNLPFGRHFIQPMGRASVAEVVLGPTRTERLRRRYGLRVEPGLEQTIAELVCADRRSPVAPTLQIILARMWNSAKAVNESAPLLDQELLATIERRDDYLADFLDRQLGVVGAQYREADQSGLVLDLLAYHTTDKATTEERLWSTIVKEYGHLPRDLLDRVLSSLIAARLLTDTPGDERRSPDERRTRLVHDTLAPRVRARFDQSQRPGQRARRILQARVQQSAASSGSGGGGFVDAPEPLAAADLALVRRGRPGMRRLTWAEEAIITATEEALAAEQAEKERRAAQQRAADEAVAQEKERRHVAERRTRNALGVFAAVVLVATFVAAGLWRRASHDAEERARRLAESIFDSAQKDMSERGDVTRALLKIANAVATSPREWQRLDAYISRAAHLASLSPTGVVPLGGRLTEAAISKDGRRVLLVRPNGALELRDGLDGSLLRDFTSSRPDAQSQGGRQMMTSPAISPTGRFAAALVPWNVQTTGEGTTRGTLVVAWDCVSGKEWLRAPLPQGMAITPGRVALTSTEDGWIIARIEALGFDGGGGLPFATSSAELVAWHVEAKVAQPDRPPDVRLEARAMQGALSPSPSTPTRIAFIPERDSNKPERVEDSSLAVYDLFTRETTYFPDAPLASSKEPDEPDAITWTDDGKRILLGVSVDDKKSEIFELHVYDIVTKAAVISSTRIDRDPEDKQPVVLTVASASEALVVAPTRIPGKLRLIAWDVVSSPNGAEAKTKSLTRSVAEFRRFVSFADQGKSLVTFGEDDKIRMIHLRTGRTGDLLRPPVAVPTQIVRASVVASGSTLVTISLDGMMMRWAVQPEMSWEGSEGISSPPAPTESMGLIRAAAFARNLSAAALIREKGRELEVRVVDLTGDPPRVGSMPGGNDWISFQKISTGDDAERFPDFHSIALNDAKQVILMARSHIGQPRELVVSVGRKPCTLSPPPAMNDSVLSVNGRSIVTCGEQGCMLSNALSCAPRQEVGTIPSTTLGADLLAVALAGAREVSRDPQSKNTFMLDFGAGQWHSHRLPGVAEFLTWVDSDTGLEITPPKAGGKRLNVISASSDGRMLGVTVIEESGGGQSELGAWDSATGQAMTIVGGGSWPSGPDLVAAAFSQDGQWLYALASDGTLRRQWVAGHGHRPDWVGDAARALTGYRSVGNTALEPLDGAALAQVRARAIALTREAEHGGDAAAGLALRALERIKISTP